MPLEARKEFPQYRHSANLPKIALSWSLVDSDTEDHAKVVAGMARALSATEDSGLLAALIYGGVALTPRAVQNSESTETV